MERINTYNEILEDLRVVKDLKKGFITNLFPDENKLNLWIKKKLLFVEHYSNTTIFLRENENFLSLYFISTDQVTLEQALKQIEIANQNRIFVFDILGKEPGVQNLLSVFENNGYFQYTSLQRMSKTVLSESFTGNIRDVKFAQKDQAFEIHLLLNSYFDPFAEQLPLIEEIYQWIESRSIKIIEEQNEIIGFVIYELIGLTSYLRYWFVHPAHRDKNIGSSLLRNYFQQSTNSDRQLFWVIRSNQNAIKRYIHYGFKQENLVDFVMINKNLKYERTGN